MFGNPDISVAPSTYDFGSINVDSSSTPQTFTISNIGSADLHISGMTLSDTANYPLNVNGGASPCGSTTPTITPDGNCTVTVTFNPLSSGQKDATLTVTSDDPDTPTLNVPLSGTGVDWVKLIASNGGEVIPSGSTYAIQWAASPNAVKFDLQYSMNNGGTWITIANKITGTSYNWTVPKPLKNKKKCLVKVIGYDASNVKVAEDTSDSTFTIEVLRVTSPNGGETWKVGTTHAITWTTNGTKKPVAKVKLFYTTGGGVWNLIQPLTLTGNPGTYNWKVPAAASANCKVKVILKDASGVNIGSDVSDNVFTIQP